MSAVKALSVSGYKSIRELRDFPLTNLNVLIGANGAGKSNFIGLFKLLNQMYEQQLQLFAQKQGGVDALFHFGHKVTEQMQVSFYFGSEQNKAQEFDSYKFQLVPTLDHRLVFKNEFCELTRANVSLTMDLSKQQEQEHKSKVLEVQQKRKVDEANQKVVAAAIGGTLGVIAENPWLAVFGAFVGYTLQNEAHIKQEALNIATIGFPGHSESGLKTAQDDVSVHVKKSVSNWRVYHFGDTSETAKVKQKHASNINLRLLPDASNLAPYLRMLHENHPNEYRHIVEVIRLVAPFFDDFVHRPNNPEYVELEWTQVGKPDMPFKAHYLSDGTLRFMCLATLLLQPIALLPDTILIDEPELGLHPYAISVLADMFKQVAEDKQLIVSTQSVELVNVLSPEDIIVVEQADGASTFKRFTQEELSGWLEEYSLGDLWNSNILGGRP